MHSTEQRWRQAPPSPSAIAELLLEHALPRLADAAERHDTAWYSSGAMGGLLETLPVLMYAASLRSALRSRLLQRGGAASFQQAARVARAVPLEVPEGMPADRLAAAHGRAAKLMSDLGLLLSSAAGEPDRQAAAINTAAAGQRSRQPDGRWWASCRTWRQ